MAGKRGNGKPNGKANGKGNGAAAEALDPGALAEAVSETEKRVDRIVDLMTRGAWVAGVSHRKLAQDWGVTISRVEQLASEASRLIRRALRGANPDELVTRHLAGLEALRATALQRQRRRWRRERDAEGKIRYVEYREADPDIRGALEAVKLAAQLAGVLQDRVVVQHEEFDGWSEADLRRFAETGERPGDHGKRIH